jgi:prepilin-type N-terminal cleavage/methylation domain-containing protein
MTIAKVLLSSARIGAFTLIEMMVALAVFAILLLFLGQVITLTGQAITANTTKLDAAGQARVFFDRLALDLAASPQRSDLGMLFTKNDGGSTGMNDAIQFYSSVNGLGSSRQFSWISYQILPATYQLERAAGATDYAGGTPVSFLPDSLPVPDANNYQVMASGIFRLELCYLRDTGSFSNSTGGTSSTDYSHVKGIVVGVVVINGRSAALLNTAKLEQLAQDFGDTTEGHDPETDWNTAIAQSGFAPGIPRPVVQNLTIFQRIFNVP